jgi:hypothetical protein
MGKSGSTFRGRLGLRKGCFPNAYDAAGNFAAVPGVQSRVISCEIRGGRSGTFLTELLRFPLPISIPPLLHTHLSHPPAVCDSPDQAAHYHILSL